MPNTYDVSGPTPPRRLAIFGNVGTQNLGDEATLAAVLQNLRRRDPGAELCAFVLYPRDTQRRHGIEAYPQRRGRKYTSTSDPVQPPSDRTVPGGVVTGWRHRAKAMLRRWPLLFLLLTTVRNALALGIGLLMELVFVLTSIPKLARCDALIVAGSGQLLDHIGGTWQYPYTCFRWVLLARLLGLKV